MNNFNTNTNKNNSVHLTIYIFIYLRPYSAAKKPIIKQGRSKRETKQIHTHEQKQKKATCTI